MLFIYLYHGVLYADLWKSDLYIRPAGLSSSLFVTLAKSTFLDHIVLFVFGLSCPIHQKFAQFSSRETESLIITAAYHEDYRHKAFHDNLWN